MRIFVMGTMCFALTACQTASAPPVTAAIDDQKAFAMARTAVTQALKDPESAKFGPTFTRKRARGNLLEERDIVCGTVNARNSFGGYTGPKIFAFMMDTQEVMLDQTVAGFDPGETWCAFAR